MRHRSRHLPHGIRASALDRIRILRPLGGHIAKLDHAADALDLDDAMFRIGDLDLLHRNAIRGRRIVLGRFVHSEQRNEFVPGGVRVLHAAVVIEHDDPLVERIEDGLEKADFVRQRLVLAP